MLILRSFLVPKPSDIDRRLILYVSGGGMEEREEPRLWLIMRDEERLGRKK